MTSPPPTVHTVRTPVDGLVSDAAETYAKLVARFGDDEVFLLESAGGPAEDCRTSVLGFGVLLTVAVTDGELLIEGVDALVAHVRRSLLGERSPVREVDAGRFQLTGPDALWTALRRITSCLGAAEREAGFDFLTFLAYDAVQYIERLPRHIERAGGVPDVCLTLHAGHLRTELDTGQTDLLVHRCPAWEAPEPADIVALLAGPAPDGDPDGPAAEEVVDDMAAHAYADRASRCLEHIAAGDIYQVQIGHEVTVRTDASPLSVYRRLRHRNPSPYMYLAGVGGHVVVGASPELFVRVGGGRITMRPIAGTAACDEGDAGAVGERLRSDPKEIAEHVMLVDLCRNDVGRVCAVGTLDVPQMMAVQRYSRVVHLVSTVEGAVADGRDVWDVVAATFPAGTMTGAPKVRAMEIIESMETSRRGLYAGAIGMVGTGGDANLALCIRTLVGDGECYRARASAGIVADSRPHAEWRETLTKIGAAYWAVTGEEPAP